MIMNINRKDEPNVLVIASPSPITGGGGLRALRSLKEYVKHFNVFLFTPWGLWDNKKILQESAIYLRDLKNVGVRFAGFSRMPKAIHRPREIIGTRLFELFLSLTLPSMARMNVGIVDYDAIVVLHEVWDAVYSGIATKELFGAPSAIILQLPPFYGSRRRFLNIMKATLWWRELRGDSSLERALFKWEVIIRGLAEERLQKPRYEKALRKYDSILGISKAIVAEMGHEWSDKVRCLDPGVSLDYEDLEVIKRIKRRVKEKENYMVLGGRPSVDKGLVEALIATKLIAKHLLGIKLIVTGRITPVMLLRIKKACKKLGVDDKVVFTGFVSREKRFEIVAKAKLMLYPSHVDAFPYAVLESLHLGTPVVAYKIPALEIYYGKCPGVELVEECDVEALTIKAIDVLERGVEAVEPPKIKSWREIMSEEVELISRLTSR